MYTHKTVPRLYNFASATVNSLRWNLGIVVLAVLRCHRRVHRFAGLHACGFEQLLDVLRIALHLDAPIAPLKSSPQIDALLAVTFVWAENLPLELVDLPQGRLQFKKLFFLTHHQEVVHVEGDLQMLLLLVIHAWRSLRLQAPQRLPDMLRPELRGVARPVQGLDQPRNQVRVS